MSGGPMPGHTRRRGDAAAEHARRGPTLVIDTATEVALLALADAEGRILAEVTWAAGYRHGEELLARLDGLLRSSSLRPSDLRAIVVGTGPGAFTGLRVGLATAKGLAHGLGIPIAGVSTGGAFLEAARDGGELDPVLVLPAGPNDRVVVEQRPGGDPVARRVTGDADLDVPTGSVLVAVDLDGRADGASLDRGRRARTGLAPALARLGGRRLAAGGDDLATLVPEYVTLPRGIDRESGSVVIGRS
jgi:tRNA threonylcarbamoyl adenosine modification protein YeaZ